MATKAQLLIENAAQANEIARLRVELAQVPILKDRLAFYAGLCQAVIRGDRSVEAQKSAYAEHRQVLGLCAGRLVAPPARPGQPVPPMANAPSTRSTGDETHA